MNRTVTLRSPTHGEWGWIISVHGLNYWKEHKYNEGFERYVCSAIFEFLKFKDVTKSKAWIADLDGKPMGCILCVQENEQIAKFQLFFVLPEARGIGLGTKLLEEAINFAKESGYSKIRLWTHDDLIDARRLYNKAGFKLIDSFIHCMFGYGQEGQLLELKL